MYYSQDQWFAVSGGELDATRIGYQLPPAIGQPTRARRAAFATQLVLQACLVLGIPPEIGNRSENSPGRWPA